MAEDNLLRQRLKVDDKKQNGFTECKEEKPSSPQFTPRESTLTVLFESSLHIKTIYHIFNAILIILLLDTLVYDIFEHGKINLGINSVIYGFGDVCRCAKLWIFEFSLALIFHPGLKLYAFGVEKLKNNKVASIIWSQVFLVGLVVLHILLITIPVVDLGKVHLALASACVVSLEMIRFSMKIYSITIACVPRCRRAAPGQQQIPSFGHYLYFLFAPTLLYRDSYPRTKKIRWSLVFYHFMEVAAIIFYNSFLWERFILPYWSDYGKETKVEIGKILRGMFACIFPGMISFLCGFYCLLHAWLNAFAEILTFADRLFYEDWWTMSQFSKYYRAWNRVVYSWLRHYIYLPLAPLTGRTFATFIVFLVNKWFKSYAMEISLYIMIMVMRNITTGFQNIVILTNKVSAIAHELVLALSFGFFYPVLLIEFGVLGLLCVPLTATSGRRYPNALNLLMWLSFLIGNGILWSLYPMEHFARKNCPPSEGDSFFIPKSWSCPEIIMKPNWTFSNPLIY